MGNTIRVGTYNTNNLFDRFDDPYSSSDDPWARRFASKPKKLDELFELGARIRSSNLDILALQEVESFGALREFIKGHVGPAYKLNGVVSVESNDPRGIDLAVVSKFPLGRIVSHRYRTSHGATVFSRDCLQVEVLNSDTDDLLLTLFVCHLKSKYSQHHPVDEEDKYLDDQDKSNRKRALQVAETIEIVKACQDVNTDRFVILGDMNDTPDATTLNDFLRPGNDLKLHNVLGTIPQADDSPDSTKRRLRDTHKWSKDPDRGHPETTYSQLDYILLSKALKTAATENVKVEQRGNTTGSDHYVCWVELDLDAM